MFSLPFDKQPLKKEVSNAVNRDAPMLKYAEFELKNLQDTYLDMRKWGKGVIWVNGHNLGKYWSIGPQQTIYLPAEWLKKGKNQVVVLDLLKTDQQFLTSLNKPILDQINTR
jgi:beta-galactosidase